MSNRQYFGLYLAVIAIGCFVDGMQHQYFGALFLIASAGAAGASLLEPRKS